MRERRMFEHNRMEQTWIKLGNHVNLKIEKKTMETNEMFLLSSIHFVYRVQSAQKNKRETT